MNGTMSHSRESSQTTGSSGSIVDEQQHTQRTRDQKLSEDELRQRKAKRKSNAYMAAEAVQHERDAVTALKRLSIGRSSITIDPDLPFGVDGDFNYNDYERKNRQGNHHRRSSSDSSISSKSALSIDDGDETLINDLQETEEIQRDAERLLWVPAKAHPSIAPDQFRRHVQSTLSDMSNKLHVRTSSSDSSQSIPSLKELTDELDKLSEMAGLAVTDAVTLARSLSSASASSSLLRGDRDIVDFIGDDESDEPTSPHPSEDEIDQDEPIVLGDSSSSLRRNKWGTYSRSHRRSKGKERLKRHSPLVDDGKFDTSNSASTAVLEKELPTLPVDSPNKELPLSKNTTKGLQADQKQPWDWNTQGSHENTESINRETRHSRNRHVGSIIAMDNNDINPNRAGSKHPAEIHPSTAAPHNDEHNRLRELSHTLPQKGHQHQQNLDQSHYANANGMRESTASHQIASNHSQLPTQQINSSHQQEALHIDTKETNRESKSKDNGFLKMFKMKRSPSGSSSNKLNKESSLTTMKNTLLPQKSTPITNDENRPLHSKQHYEHQHLSQTKLKSSHSTLPTPSSTSASQETVSTPQQRPSLKSTALRFTRNKSNENFSKSDSSQPQTLQDSVKVSPNLHQRHSQDSKQIPAEQNKPESLYLTGDPRAKAANEQSKATQQQGQNGPPNGIAQNEEQQRLQREILTKKLKLQKSKQTSTKPNAPVQFTDSAFGFPLPPLTNSTVVMLDHRYPIHVERALYRLSHLKLANPRRPLRQQVLLSNFMYAYLNLVNHTLYLQELDEANEEGSENEVVQAERGLQTNENIAEN